MPRAGDLAVAPIELQRGETGLLAEHAGSDLIGGDVVVKSDSPLEAIRSCQPIGAAPVGFREPLVGQSLH